MTIFGQNTDEAIRLMNVSDSPVKLSSWTLTNGEGTITLAGTLAGDESTIRLGLGRLLSPV
jgi:hypothetical protein